MTAENKTDLQDLIHENMMRAYEKGQQTERERIIKQLEVIIESLKGEQK